MDKLVSIILPTYNRANLLRNCINSVLQQHYQPIELIICDDCSDDDTPTIIADIMAEKDKITYIRNEKRLGLPSNRNVGIVNSTGNFIFFIEDDMILDPLCVEYLFETYMQFSTPDKCIGGVTPSLVTHYPNETHEKKILFCAGRTRNLTINQPCSINPFTGMRSYNFSPNFQKSVCVPDMHACSFYPRPILEKVGGYDESTYKGNYLYEETDLNQRISNAGYIFYFQPKAILHHYISSEGGCRVKYIRYCYFFIINHIKFLIKNYREKSVYMIPSFIILAVIIGLKTIFNRLSSDVSK